MGSTLRKRVSGLVSAAVLASAFFALQAGDAEAATPAALPISGFYQIVADPAHGHLFISEGDQNVIVVTDLSGTEVATIDGQYDAAGIALSPDGSTLYAALGGDDAVSAISTSTLKQTALYQLGNGDSPMDVAVQSDKVWVSYATGTAGEAAIGAIDLSATTPAFETQSTMGGWYNPPELAADPSGSGVLVAAEPGLSPTSLATYNTATDPATVLAQNGHFDNCSNEEDLAVTPGGSDFVLACGSPYVHDQYSTATLDAAGDYPSTRYPDAVAMDANGDVAAGTGSNPSDPDLYVYAAGGSTPLSTFNLADPGGYNLAARGLAFLPDGSQLFAVLQDPSVPGTFALQVLQDPTLTTSGLTLSGSPYAYIGQDVNLSGALTLASGSTPTGTEVDITRSVEGGTQTQTFTADTTTGGHYTLSDIPPGTGVYTYSASYSGSASVAPSTATFTVTVTKIRADLTLSGPGSIAIGKKAYLTGQLTTASDSVATGTPVTITRSLKGETQTSQFTVKTRANGDFSLTDTPPAAGDYTYTASYAGSSVFTAATTSTGVTVSKILPVLTLSAGPSRVNYDTAIHLSAHLGPTFKNRTVSIYAQPLGSSKKTLVKTGKVNSAGDLAASYVAPHSTEFSVTFAGDAHYLAEARASTVGVYAQVAQTISGYYGHKRLHGVTYWLFHSNATLKVHATVTPKKAGECVVFEVQEYYQGAWHANVSTPCVKLSKASTAAAAFGLSHADLGQPYRVRSDFVRSGTDSSNLSSDSAWDYTIVNQ